MLKDEYIVLSYIKNTNFTFYDSVGMIHDVILTPNSFPYTAKFMFVGIRNNKTQQVRCWKINRICM